VASPRTLIGLVSPQFLLLLVSPVTLILFLVVLYQESTGSAGPRRRQVSALAAASGMAVGIGLRAWQMRATAVTLRSLPPQIRAQFSAATFDIAGQWRHALFTSFIPAVLWIGFLLLFWRDVAPLGRKWTRRSAFVLCLVTTAQGVNQIGGILSGVHRYLADTPGLAGALQRGQGQTQGRDAALTLAVRLIGPCGSLGAGAPMQLSGTARSYCLKQPTIVDQGDIGAAEFDQNADDGSAIRLTPYNDAARRLTQVTGKNIGLQIGVVMNGQLVSVETIAAPTGQVWITGLAHDAANRVIEAFRRPVLTFWNLVTLAAFWNLVIVTAVRLAATAALPCFLFSVWWTRSAPAAGAVAL